jgi:hypothetical protein
MDITALVNEVTLYPQDVIIIHAPVGDLPPTKVKEMLDLVSAKMKEKFSNELIVFASKVREYQITIVHNK